MARVATGNTEEALDIVQDAMTRLVKKYALRPEDEWTPLFYKILQSLIRDWYRKQSVRNRFRLFWDTTDSSDPIETAADREAMQPDKALSHGIAIEQIYEALNQLPHRQQQAFLLRAMEGLDTQATAEAMQCSQSSVKTHYGRAIKVLRQVLAPHYDANEPANPR